MKHLFYFLAILPLMFEMMVLSEPTKAKNFSQKLKGIKADEMTSQQQSYTVLCLGYWVWCFVGIFTFQWPLFLLIFALGFIPKTETWMRAIDAFITILILLFILLNAYHFKIDIWHWLIK